MVLEVILWSAAVLLVVAGLVGLVLPALPGPPLIFLGLLSGAWAEGFAKVGLKTLLVLAVMAAVAYLADFVAGAYGARRFGASPKSAVGAAIGAVVGIFFGLPGLLLGPFVGAVIGELIEVRDIMAAGRAGVGATVGLVLGTAAKVSLGLSMVAVFIFVWIIGTAW